MAAPVPLRSDFDAEALRALAKGSRDPAQTRRLLALSVISAGGSRSDAAEIGGVGLQTVRDWVVTFNADGPSGLIDGKAPVARPRPERRLARGSQDLGRTGADARRPRRGALALVRSGPDPVRGSWRVSLRTDFEPGLAGNGLSQTLGSPAPSRPGPGRRSYF